MTAVLLLRRTWRRWQSTGRPTRPAHRLLSRPKRWADGRQALPVHFLPLLCALYLPSDTTPRFTGLPLASLACPGLQARSILGPGLPRIDPGLLADAKRGLFIQMLMGGMVSDIMQVCVCFA